MQPRAAALHGVGDRGEIVEGPGVDLARLRAHDRCRVFLPITRAATESGFYDRAHFTRHFKRLMGITPGQYLRQGQSRP
jgi:AraC-like DNA-binding protein